MIHPKRRFSVKPATLAEIAADFERSSSWCNCNSYLVEHNGARYLLLNDAFEGDSGVEHAICRIVEETTCGYTVEQLESLTTSWVEPERLAAKIVECIEQPFYVSKPFAVRCDHYMDHDCRLCA